MTDQEPRTQIPEKVEAWICPECGAVKSYVEHFARVKCGCDSPLVECVRATFISQQAVEELIENWYLDADHPDFTGPQRETIHDCIGELRSLLSPNPEEE